MFSLKELVNIDGAQYVPFQFEKWMNTLGNQGMNLYDIIISIICSFLDDRISPLL